MENTCFNCKQTWQVPAGESLAAKLKFGLGSRKHTVTCPHCGAKNIVTRRGLRFSDRSVSLIPVTGGQNETDIQTNEHSRARRQGGSAPVNPVPGPDPNSRPRDGIVLERRLHAYREPKAASEVMAPLRKGEKVTILDIWVDGENNPWAQLGPERWVPIERDGEVYIEFLED